MRERLGAFACGLLGVGLALLIWGMYQDHVKVNQMWSALTAQHPQPTATATK